MPDKFRVVSVGDNRSATRVMRILQAAFDDAGIDLTPDENRRLKGALLKHYLESGLVLTWQVGR